jgi:hypothetical protein
MTSFHRDIEMLQEPMDLSVDKNQRPYWAFNVIVTKTFSRQISEEVAKILVDASVGVVNTNIFLGLNKPIPDGDGPFLLIVETGGLFPERTHNDVTLPAWQRPATQISVRGTSVAATKEMIWEAYEALVGVRNLSVTP